MNWLETEIAAARTRATAIPESSALYKRRVSDRPTTSRPLELKLDYKAP